MTGNSQKIKTTQEIQCRRRTGMLPLCDDLYPFYISYISCST